MGTTSRIREVLVADMVSMEMWADHIRTSEKVNASLLGPNIDMKKFGQAIERYNDRLAEAGRLMEYDRFYADEMAMMRKRQGESLMNAFQKLKKSGTIDAFRKRALKIIQQLNRIPPTSSFSSHA